MAMMQRNQTFLFFALLFSLAFSRESCFPDDRVKLIKDKYDCEMKCMEESDAGECVEQCMQEKYNDMADYCLQCIGDEELCIVNNCQKECENGIDEDCFACMTGTGCILKFLVCFDDTVQDSNDDSCWPDGKKAKVDFIEDKYHCEIPCMKESDAAKCVEQCMQKKYDLSDYCSDCLGKEEGCIVQYCQKECEGGVDMDCFTCMAGTDCILDFLQCYTSGTKNAMKKRKGFKL